MRILLTIFLLVWSITSQAATNAGIALTAAAIQAAVDAAAQGDTLILTNGSASFTTKVNVAYKNLHIYGSNGTNTSQWDTSTTLDQNITSPDLKQTLFNCDIHNTNFLEFRGIKFTCSVKCNNGMMQIERKECGPGNRTDGYTNGCSFRVHRCNFNYEPSVDTSGSGAFRALTIKTATGLIDHCYFEKGASGGGQSIAVDYDAASGTGVTNYEAPQLYGTTNCVVIEDCGIYHKDFYGDDGIEAYSTTKFVARYNAITNTGIGLHGPDSDSRGCRQFEIYSNLFYNTGTTPDHLQILLFRSGAGVIYSNLVQTTSSGNRYSSFCTMRVYRANSSYSPYGTAFHHLPTGGLQGPCNGSRIVDGNFDSFGYPAIDQVGRGSFPASWTYPTDWPYISAKAEALEPIYMWGNTNSGTYQSGGGINGWGLDTLNDTDNVTNFVKEGRDVYDGTVKPGYTPLIYPHPWVTAMDGGGNQPSEGPYINNRKITPRIRIRR